MDDIETRVVAMDMVIAMGIPEDFADVSDVLKRAKIIENYIARGTAPEKSKPERIAEIKEITACRIAVVADEVTP